MMKTSSLCLVGAIVLLAVSVRLSVAECTKSTCPPGHAITQSFSGVGCAGNSTLDDHKVLNKCGESSIGQATTSKTTCSAAGGLRTSYYQTNICFAGGLWLTDTYPVGTCINLPFGAGSFIFWCDIASVPSTPPTKNIPYGPIPTTLPVPSDSFNCSSSGCDVNVASTYLYEDDTCSGTPLQVISTNALSLDSNYFTTMRIDTCYSLESGSMAATFSCDEKTATIREYFGDCASTSPFRTREMAMGACLPLVSDTQISYYKSVCRAANTAVKTSFGFVLIFALLALCSLL